MAYTDQGRMAEALGRSEALAGPQERISRAARANRPVLLPGERGPAKKLAAPRLPAPVSGSCGKSLFAAWPVHPLWVQVLEITGLHVEPAVIAVSGSTH